MHIPNYLSKMTVARGKPITLVGCGRLFRCLYDEMTMTRPMVKQELTRKLKVSQRTLYNWFSEKKAPAISIIEAFLEIWCEICNKTEEEKDSFMQTFYASSNLFSVSGGKQIILPRTICTDLSYILGYLQGDGHLANPYSLFEKKKRMGCKIAVYEESYIHLDTIIRPLLFKLFNVQAIVRKSHLKNCHYLSFHSRIVHLFLTEVCGLPSGKKSRNVHAPKIIVSCSKQIKRAFLQGLFDSDGSIYSYQKNGKTKTKINFRQISLPLVSQVKEFLSCDQIRSNGPYWDRRAGVWLLEVVNPLDLKLFKELVGFRHHKKLERLTNFCSPVV